MPRAGDWKTADDSGSSSSDADSEDAGYGPKRKKHRDKGDPEHPYHAKARRSSEKRREEKAKAEREFRHKIGTDTSQFASEGGSSSSSAAAGAAASSTEPDVKSDSKQPDPLPEAAAGAAAAAGEPAGEGSLPSPAAEIVVAHSSEAPFVETDFRVLPGDRWRCTAQIHHARNTHAAGCECRWCYCFMCKLHPKAGRDVDNIEYAALTDKFEVTAGKYGMKQACQTFAQTYNSTLRLTPDGASLPAMHEACVAYHYTVENPTEAIKAMRENAVTAYMIEALAAQVMFKSEYAQPDDPPGVDLNVSTHLLNWMKISKLKVK